MLSALTTLLLLLPAAPQEAAPVCPSSQVAAKVSTEAKQSDSCCTSEASSLDAALASITLKLDLQKQSSSTSKVASSECGTSERSMEGCIDDACTTATVVSLVEESCAASKCEESQCSDTAVQAVVLKECCEDTVQTVALEESCLDAEDTSSCVITENSEGHAVAIMVQGESKIGKIESAVAECEALDPEARLRLLEKRLDRIERMLAELEANL